jgi:hypothetical protein
MLQCLAQFRVALLDLFKQPHVFYGDHCLRSEGLEKRNLFVSKRTDFGSPNKYGPNRNSLAK